MATKKTPAKADGGKIKMPAGHLRPLSLVHERRAEAVWCITPPRRKGKSMPTISRTINFRLSLEAKQRLQKIATRRNLTVSALVIAGLPTAVRRLHRRRRQ